MTRHRPTAHFAPAQVASECELGEPPKGLDPELLVAFAARGITHSNHPVSCGLSLAVEGRPPETIAATDDVPVHVDWLQHELRQGPDITRWSGQVVVSRDLARDPRWPDFGRMCVAVLGLQSMVSVAVPLPADSATLKFFSSDPAAFDRFDVDAALRLAGVAGSSAFAAVQELVATGPEPPGSEFSRVAVALGTVMSVHGVGAAEGFALLRGAARDLGRSLFAVAVEVVESGRLPTAGPDPRNDLTGRRPATGGTAPAGLRVGGPELWTRPGQRAGRNGS